MHPSVARALEEIDAALYSGDSFYAPMNYAVLQDYLTRWSRRLVEIADEQQQAFQDACNDDPSGAT